MKFAFVFLSLFFSFQSFAIECETLKPVGQYRPLYAKYFTIDYFNGFKIINIKTETVSDRVLIAERNLTCTSKLFIFKSPVRKMVATSTTHLPFLSQFKMEDKLVGFQGVNYIVHPNFKINVIKNINYQLNPEELISLHPDLVMAYTANLSSSSRLRDLRHLKIPLVLNYDFEEKHPLARAEWMIFVSAFFDKDNEAIDLFSKTVKSYNDYKQLVRSVLKKKILIGDIQNGRWISSGGASDLAILINDAGGELLLQNDSRETQSISLEIMLKTKTRPDFWLPQNTWSDLSLVKRDTRYKTFSNIPIFNNNKNLNSSGFNDFWETGLSRPDLLLKDLIAIFHPEIMPRTDLIWYKQLI